MVIVTLGHMEGSSWSWRYLGLLRVAGIGSSVPRTVKSRDSHAGYIIRKFMIIAFVRRFFTVYDSFSQRSYF